MQKGKDCMGVWSYRYGEPHKFTEVAWFKLNNLPKPLHSQFPDFIKRYKDKL